VNPPGDVTAAMEVCARPLRDAGFDIRMLPHAPGKPNLVAEWGPADGPMLCFNAHLDVVPIGDERAWTHAPFGAEIAEGRVYGRGAGDDKASVTAQVMGALALARSGVPLRGRLAVTEVADEETTGAGAKHLAETAGFQTDRVIGVIVGEQTLNRVAAGARLMAPCPGKARMRSTRWPGSSSR
jgi:acetylornithine deacetylase/succinyl-diaminopimelate desuccinylase-like protein